MPSSKGTIKTSVIIPVYNTRAYLEECLESVLAQTQREFEVILVDDGSTDGSVDIIDRYVERHPNIFKVQQEHEFQGTARNRGLKIARGEYVYFMDSDDRINPQLFERCYEVCERDGLDFATFDAHGFLDTPSDTPLTDICDRTVLGIDGRIWDGPGFWNAYYNRRGILYLCWLHYIRRDFLLEHNLLYEERTYFEDNDWTLRLYMAATRFRYLPEQLCDHRWRHGSNMNEGFTVDLMRGCFRMHDVLLRLYRENAEPSRQSMVFDVLRLNVDRFGRLAATKPDSGRIALLEEFVGHVTEMAARPESTVEERFVCAAVLRKIAQSTSAWGSDVHENAASGLQEVLGLLSALWASGRRVGIYGMGKVSDRFVDAVEEIAPMRADVVYLDTNAPTGGAYRGRPVYNIADAPGLGLDAVVVASTKYRDEMTEMAQRVLGASTCIEQIAPQIGLMVQRGCL